MRRLDYPIVLHKEPDSDYGVSVPDLPGCVTAGSTIEEALAMAKEAIELHLEGLVEDGRRVPRSRPIQRHLNNPEYEDGVWALVTVRAPPSARRRPASKRRA